MRYRLKSFFPRSLFGRAALILVLPVIVIQLIVSVAFIQRHFESVTRQMTEGVAIELAHITAKPDRPQAEAAAKALQITTNWPDPSQIPQTDNRLFWDWSGREVILTLRAAFPDLIVVDLGHDTRQLSAYLNTANGPIQLTLPRARVSASNPHQLLVWMVFTSALMTYIAFIFLRNQLRPITALSEAAIAFGKGQTLAYRPRGATEVRAAGAAFLDMRARIERQIESRTLMLSGVSHDLRTPLTRLKLGLSFLPEDDDTRALQGDVVDMERLVDEFLAFARGDAMEVAEPTDPAALLARVVENAQRAGGAVVLGPVVVAGPCTLRPMAIARALENLIGNALRYGNRAEVSLQKRGGLLCFVIEDDGSGIPLKDRDAALEPFRRLDAARNPNHGGGVGLGLSIAMDIARSHGGNLRLGQSQGLGGLRAELSIAM